MVRCPSASEVRRASELLRTADAASLMQRCPSASELLRSADAACNGMLRSSSAEFTEMMRSAADRCKRARNNVKFLELPPSLRRPYILTAYRANHDLRSCVRSLFQVSQPALTSTPDA